MITGVSGKKLGFVEREEGTRFSPCVGLEGRRLRNRSAGTTLGNGGAAGGRQLFEGFEVDTATALPASR